MAADVIEMRVPGEQQAHVRHTEPELLDVRADEGNRFRLAAVDHEVTGRRDDEK